MQPIRFIHLTDTHIGRTPYYAIYGRQSLPCLQRAVQVIADLPMEYDFVLHTGDVADDGSAEAYAMIDEAIAPLRKRCPVHFVVGNHDHADRLASLGGFAMRDGRCDRAIELSQSDALIILDSRGPIDPGGRLLPSQLDWLRDQLDRCAGRAIVAVHHSPITLDTAWLDHPPEGWGGRFMYIDNAPELRALLRAQREKIAGVFFGHVHGGYQSMQDGVLYVAGRSLFAQLSGLPTSTHAKLETDQPGGFSIVTVLPDQTIVRERLIV